MEFMPDKLKEILDQKEDLQKEFSKLRGDFDKPGDLTKPELDSFSQRAKQLEEKANKFKTEFFTIENTKKIIQYEIAEIEHAIGKIERGFNDTGSIIGAAKKISENLENLHDAKKDVERIESNCKDMVTDVEEERHRNKLASIINHVMQKIT
jgi:chromosome segregation ATPase